VGCGQALKPLAKRALTLGVGPQHRGERRVHGAWRVEDAAKRTAAQGIG
jgi:hypothetical protein